MIDRSEGFPNENSTTLKVSFQKHLTKKNFPTFFHPKEHPLKTNVFVSCATATHSTTLISIAYDLRLQC